MLGKESDFWQNIVKPKLGQAGHFERIENGVGSGTPDVSYSFWSDSRQEQRCGWIELKVIDSLPITNGAVFVSHFRKSQRVWHTRYAMHRGRSYVLLYIKREKKFWLFNGKEACRWMGKPLSVIDYDRMNLETEGIGIFPTNDILSIL